MLPERCNRSAVDLVDAHVPGKPAGKSELIARMKPHRRAILIVTVAAVGIWAIGQWESPKRRAYRICAECADLKPPDVDGLIAAVRLSTQSREQSLELYRRTLGRAAAGHARRLVYRKVFDIFTRLNPRRERKGGTDCCGISLLI